MEKPSQEKQYEIDHDMALAMKPEMDVIAEERATAQPTGVNWVIDGEMRSTGGSRHFEEPGKDKVHSAREFYAESNAKQVKDAYDVINNTDSTTEEIATAQAKIDALTQEDAPARDEEAMKKIVADTSKFDQSPSLNESLAGIVDPEEVKRILDTASWSESMNGILREQEVALQALESTPGNNSGIGNVEFARSQFMSNLYETRKKALDIESGEAEGQEYVLEALIDEGKMWEKIIKGEPTTLEEEKFIRGRSQHIRESAIKKSRKFA